LLAEEEETKESADEKEIPVTVPSIKSLQLPTDAQVVTGSMDVGEGVAADDDHPLPYVEENEKVVEQQTIDRLEELEMVSESAKASDKAKARLLEVKALQELMEKERQGESTPTKPLDRRKDLWRASLRVKAPTTPTLTRPTSSTARVRNPLQSRQRWPSTTRGSKRPKAQVQRAHHLQPTTRVPRRKVRRRLN
jgi:hypothetical protein